MNRVTAAILPAVLAAAALLGPGQTWARAEILPASTVEMLDNAFSPAALTIAPGTVVTFANRGARAHTVTASTPAGAFDSGYVMPGASWSFTFTTSGTFVYHCEIHTGMVGSITVTGGPAPPAGNTISLTDNQFTPAFLAVAPGTTVTWRNDGSVTHTVTSTAFGAQRLAPGASFSYTFASAGTYPYACDVHAGMSGVVTVGSPAPAATPTPTPVSTPPPAGANAVMIMNNLFTPASLTVDPGAAVTWTNHDTVTHTVTRDGLFDLLARPGQSVTFTFMTPGTYDYYCAVHSGMTGTIVVRGAAATPTATPSPSPSPSPSGAPAGDTVVDVSDNLFTPSSVSVPVGGSVTWRNTGAQRHTVSGPGFGATLSPGQSYRFTFTTAGGYRYLCDFHPGMQGVVVVAAAGAPAPTLPPPPPLPTIAPAPSLPAGTVTVDVLDNSFSPATKEVATGTTVTWVHRARAPHTVSAANGVFDGTLFSGGTFRYTFATPGTYAYLCQFHDGMTGTIVVTGAARSALPSPAVAPTATPQPTPAPTPPPGGLTVVIADNDFTPGTTRAPVGSTVSWVNHGRIRHTVTSASSVFDSGLMSPGGVYSVTFDAPGTYPYLCDIHPAMRGTIQIYAVDGAVPPAAIPTPPPTPVSAPSPATATTGASMREIQIVDNAFEPRSVSAATGTTLRWINMGKAKHTVTFTAGATSTSELLATGAVYELTLGAPGTYAYICALHPEMTGTVTVTGAASVTEAATVTGAATPTASPSSRTTTRAATAVPRSSAGTQPKDAGTGWPWILGIGLGLIGAFGIGLPIIAALSTSPDERDAALRRRRGW